MKKLLLIIAACASFANSQIDADNAYAGVTGGVNFINTYRHDGQSIEFKPGATGAATLGYKVDCGLRTEAEFGYRYNRFSKIKVDGIRIDGRGHVNSWSTMANVIYDLPTYVCVQPYVGVGVGYAKYRVSTKHVPTNTVVKHSLDGFTHQFLAGVEYPLDYSLSLDVKYRYQKTHNVDYQQSVECGLVCAF